MFESAAISRSEHVDQFNGKCRQADVEICLNSDGDLVMFFPEKGMLQCTKDAIFSQNWFPMPAPYYLTDKLLKKLGHGVAPVIPSGQYPIQKIKGGYLITF